MQENEQKVTMLEKNESRFSINRRNVLKKTGALAGSGCFVSGLSKAKSTEQEELVGITYDGVTHEFQDTATGHVTNTKNGLKGVIKFAGFTVPFGQDSAVSPMKAFANPRYRFDKEDQKFQKNGKNLSIDITRMDDCIVGRATRPSSKFSNLGITFVPKSTIQNAQQLKRGLSSQGGKIVPPGFDAPPSVTNSGIPTATSIHNISTKRGDR